MRKRPGGELSSRPLHFIWIADCSTSMKHMGKMDSLNDAIKSSIPEMRRVAEENPNAEVLIRAIKFSTGAKWHVESEVPIEQFEWENLEAGGVTDMGKAFELLQSKLSIPPMSDRALPPVLVLISDGQPTDDYKEKLKELLRMPWAIKAVRIGIIIGKYARDEVLREFIKNPDIQPLRAENAKELVEYIKWVSTVVLKSASSPSSRIEENEEHITNVIIPEFNKEYVQNISVEDVW